MIPKWLQGATPTIEITLNGQPASIPVALSVDGLLGHLRVDPARVAVEVNRQIIRREDWPQVILAPGATVEVVHFVGGGLLNFNLQSRW